MRVIVSGAVAWTNVEAIRRELMKLPAGTVVIHGDCTGVDALAGALAVELGFGVEAMAKNAADAAKYQQLAWKGLNERMLATGADLVLVFHPNFNVSNGCKHMAEIARVASVEVHIFAG